MIYFNTRDSQNCHKAIPFKSSPYQRSLQVIKVFQRPPKCLVKMSHKNFLSKCFVKMSHSVLYVLSIIIHQCILSVLSLLSSIINYSSSINVNFLFFLYCLPSSIIHHPLMYTFCKMVKNG